MAQLFEEHDRSQFDVFAFSHGPDDDSPMRRRLVAAFDRFIDVQQDSDEDAARRIAELGIDILVDLKGHTEFARLEILARRPAPVQVHYIGYPGTLGTDFVDYLIVDPVVVRPDEAADFTEQLVFLPQCYQVNDRMRPGGTGNASRESCGLPRGGFVFCNFNNSYKITPDLFDIWMRLVKMVPDSVFWLLSDNQWADENLRREAQAHGVTADRLIFAPRLGLEEHLARQPLADLFLDTAPYSAHTTASDALWMGLPVLTIAGRSFASRVAASLLHAVHLPELVTHDRVEYERVALDLASDRQKLSALRRRLRENLLTAPLFDIARTRRDLEAAYCQMWEIYVRGEAPSSFRVAKI
jgi:predicted O-linked N-acetylglucosamine transferase (SPINDLY family)